MNALTPARDDAAGQLKTRGTPAKAGRKRPVVKPDILKVLRISHCQFGGAERQGEGGV